MSTGGSGQVQETPLQSAQAQVAQKQWANYEQKYVPLQQFYINRTNQNAPKEQQLVQGSANTDVEGQFGNAQTGLQASLANSGAETGSDKSIFGQTSLAGSRGAAVGMAKTNASDAVTRQYQSALNDIISQGRGQQATSDTALADVAGLSGQQAAAQAQAAEQEAAGVGNAIGTGAGIGGSYGLRAALDAKAGRSTPTPTTDLAYSPQLQGIQTPNGYGINMPSQY